MRSQRDEKEVGKVEGKDKALRPTGSMRPSRRSELPELINTKEAATIFGCSANTLKRWRYEGVGPEYVSLQGRPRYDLAVLLEYIRENTRMPSVRAAMESNS